jgi:hypothetical protein
MSALSPEKIEAIRAAVKAGAMRKVVAKRFGVALVTVTAHTRDIKKKEHRGRRDQFGGKMQPDERW